MNKTLSIIILQKSNITFCKCIKNLSVNRIKVNGYRNIVDVNVFIYVLLILVNGIYVN